MTKKGRMALAGYLFLLPNLLGFLVFTSLPVLASLALSFFDWDLFTPPRFVGLHNYAKLMSDHAFWYYAFNTVFLMLAIPVNMMGALFLAVVMNRKLRGIVVFRTIYFVPTIVTGVGTYLLWRWIFNPDYGLINTMLHAVGIEGPKWLQSIAWAKPALMLMGFWTAVGGNNMILYLAALQGVSPELYEAADIDGANKWQKFWRITWPMVSPTTFFILTMSLIGGFQGGFEQAMVMTGGGPAGATTTISYYIYNHAFLWNHMGYASAIAWVLFAVVLETTLLNWRFGGRVVHY
ncbi:MAG TPA: sugar ABC transporter permease [Verrucomicrobiae bacterium]|nr:sugar ABC transporter permease [Verrucomicrobiae bacterium]